MFTGIIQAQGRVQKIIQRGEDSRMQISCSDWDLSDTQLGDSIAVSGVCLTVVEMSMEHFSADVSNETLACTTLGEKSVGDAVNLEKALLPTTRLGGHLVSGHVDGVGKVKSMRQDGRSHRFEIEVPVELAKYIAAKGSVCIDGVSLTVNQVEGCCFDINIIPHTMEQTTIAVYRVGQRLNIEVDLLARYIERLLEGKQNVASRDQGISASFLTEHGFG